MTTYIRLYKTKMGWFWAVLYLSGAYLLWSEDTVPFVLYMAFMIWLVYNWDWDA